MQEASALLGVAPATLRRWANDGQIPVQRTLGGHRRFPREAIARAARASANAQSELAGERDADRLGRGRPHPDPLPEGEGRDAEEDERVSPLPLGEAGRRPGEGAVSPSPVAQHGDHGDPSELRRSQPPQTHWGLDRREMAGHAWYAQLSQSPAANQMRGLGQRLLGLLVQYANRAEDDERYLSEARLVGLSYGRRARRAELRLRDTVEACLFFRNSFSQFASPLPGLAQPADSAQAAALQARLNRFMDAILLSVIDGFEATTE